jgi:hypothetical protein
MGPLSEQAHRKTFEPAGDKFRRRSRSVGFAAVTALACRPAAALRLLLEFDGVAVFLSRRRHGCLRAASVPARSAAPRRQAHHAPN